VKFIFKVLIILFLSANVFSQDEYPHKLVFKDGHEIRGKVVVWNGRSVIFRNAKTNEKESYKYKLLKSIRYFETGEEYDGLYVLKQLKGTDRTLRLTKAVSGKVECYYIARESSAAAFGSDDTVVSSIYFMCKQGDIEVSQVRSGLRFKKTREKLKEYFSDCPDILSKIDEGDFGDKIESLEPLVRHYNTKC